MTDHAPGARVVIVSGAHHEELTIGWLPPAGSEDLALVDALARLHLASRRLGRRVELRDVDARLRDLLRLVGIDELLCGGRAQPGDERCGGSPKSAKRSG